MSDEGKLQDYSIDQVGASVVLVLGAVSSLLLVLWQSKCHCKINFCYFFQCERRPPDEREMKKLQEQYKEKKDKMNNENNDDKKEDIEKKKEGNDIENDLELLPNHNQ